MSTSAEVDLNAVRDRVLWGKTPQGDSHVTEVMARHAISEGWRDTGAPFDAELANSILKPVAQAIRNWWDTAADHAKNEQYYRGLVVQIGEMFGDDAKLCDDGSVVDEVLCAKVPDLVRAHLEAAGSQEYEAGMAWSDMAASAYRAYAHSTGNKNFRGDPMPALEDLPDAIKTAWNAATRQVGNCLESGEQAIGWEDRWKGWIPP